MPVTKMDCHSDEPFLWNLSSPSVVAKEKAAVSRSKSSDEIVKVLPTREKVEDLLKSVGLLAKNNMSP